MIGLDNSFTSTISSAWVTASSGSGGGSLAVRAQGGRPRRRSGVQERAARSRREPRERRRGEDVTQNMRTIEDVPRRSRGRVRTRSRCVVRCSCRRAVRGGWTRAWWLPARPRSPIRATPPRVAAPGPAVTASRPRGWWCTASAGRGLRVATQREGTALARLRPAGLRMHRVVPDNRGVRPSSPGGRAPARHRARDQRRHRQGRRSPCRAGSAPPATRPARPSRSSTRRKRSPPRCSNRPGRRRTDGAGDPLRRSPAR